MTPFQAKHAMWEQVEMCDDRIAAIESGPVTPPAILERAILIALREQLIAQLEEVGMI